MPDSVLTDERQKVVNLFLGVDALDEHRQVFGHLSEIGRMLSNHVLRSHGPCKSPRKANRVGGESLRRGWPTAVWWGPAAHCSRHHPSVIAFRLPSPCVLYSLGSYGGEVHFNSETITANRGAVNLKLTRADRRCAA
jgi:hypothetical protein